MQNAQSIFFLTPKRNKHGALKNTAELEPALCLYICSKEITRQRNLQRREIQHNFIAEVNS